MYLYHVTTIKKDIQSVLRPRIPEKTLPDENISIERVSLALTIFDCLRSLEIYKMFNNEEVYVRVYTVEIDENDKCLKKWTNLYQEGLVPDAFLTHEYWYTESIVPKECAIYKITNFEEKKYIIVNYNQTELIKKLIRKIGLEDNFIEKYNAFEIMNIWLPKQENDVQIYIKKNLAHRVIDYTAKDAEIYKQIFNEVPITEHDEPDFYEVSYLENCDLCLKKIIKNSDIFKFEKCTYEKLKKSIVDYNLEMAAWSIIDSDYVWHNNCYLYVIKDGFDKDIAFLYYYVDKEKRLSLSAFEVITSLRSKGFGEKIINQFINQNRLSVDNIYLESLSDKAARFWRKCNIPCFYLED